MAAPSTKLPAPVQTSRAPALPAEPKAQPPAATGSSRTFKLLVWLLVSLNVAVAGGWGYLKFFRNGEARKALTSTRKRLVDLKTNLDLLNATVRGIVQGGVNEVQDPGTLVGDVAQRMGVREHLNIGQMNAQNFLRTNYTEKVVRVTFLNKRVYEFADIVRFMKELEKANPTVQIKDIDFGKRTPSTIGSDTWIPSVATVRTLQLTSTPGS